ncbi:hypothetical protein KKG51_01740, partial [Patescibacteria group bacterium]|nr:hypothetical protein [Patescibacteria group bacterium]
METIRKIEAFVSRADEISAAEEDVPRVCMEISRLIGDLMAFEDEVPDFDGVSESDFLSEVHIKFLNLMKIVERVREEVRLVIGLNAEKFNPGRRELFKAMAKGLGKDRPPWAWKKDAGLEFSCSLVIFENLRDVL